MKIRILKEKGITLIALVITIIILLILAGVTINMVIGENGIFRIAEKSAEEHTKAGLKEELETAILEIQARKIEQGVEMKREDLTELSRIGATIGSIEIPAEGEYKNYFFEIDKNYVVTIIGKVKGEKPTITGEVITTGIVAQGGKAEIKVTAGITEGTITSIDAINGAILKTNISETEKIFEVSSNGTYCFKVVADNGRSATVTVTVNTIIENPEISIKDITSGRFTIVVNTNYAEGLVTEYKYYVSNSLKSSGTTVNEYVVTGLTEETIYSNIYVEAVIQGVTLKSEEKEISTKKEEIVWTNVTSANRTIDGQGATYKNPIIPVGFSAINTADAIWNKDNGASSEWNNGLVIKNATDGNEFVWVPVDGTDVKYEKWCTARLSYANCEDVPSTSGLDIASNIRDYGGFWIARYEAGLPTSINQTLADKTTRNVTEKPLSIAGAVPWNYIDWNNAKVNAESMYSNNYIQSGLVNGTQWDTVMKWIEKGAQHSVTNSTSWGNYINNTVNLKSGKYAYVSTDYGATWIKTTAKTNGSTQLIKTGASNDTKAKNIFDLAGNLWEVTCEKDSSDFYVVRGSSFGTDTRMESSLNSTY